MIVVREPGTPASKARPYVVVQRDSTLQGASKVTGCPITSTLHGATGRRPVVMPSDENGLRRPSEVEVDWTFTHPLECVGAKIGRLDAATMESVDGALRRWLAL